MKKKYILTFIASVILAGPLMQPIEVEASQKLEELEIQQQELESESQKIGTEVQSREEKMASLEKEKAQLEKEVTALQADIDTLVLEINEQENEIQRIKEEIERLQKEIVQLQQQIDNRNEQLESQARSVQTNASASDIVDLLMSAESLSDLVGRINVVNKLVTANQDIMGEQIADQNALEENEKQVKAEQEEMEKVKAQLEVSRNNLVNQRVELDDKIVQIAEKYEMNAEERESFINEQAILAERTSTLNEEMKAEKQRIIEEERARQEAIRIAQEKAQREAEAKAKAEAAARAKAEAKTAAAAKANDKPQAATSSNNASSTEASSNVAPTSNGWTRPARGRISSPYGWRTHPIFGDRRFHTGVDIAGSGPIIAARAGTVTTAGYNGALGYYVKVDHGDGYTSVYSHMQPNLSVARGQRVSQGQQLGIMGTTGDSTGVHLDFKVYRNGETVDPMNYIN
ncbi:Murein DD-endopeptidase MepM and murein hydrolase activator NlpD, contain LysM domain [Alkalibacterium subtropicum]|uniref:Murein DD-endopeptidase MepM and murein hydrolase activator NlpD, contain LysM domain n=2 Tax=Alkalibacterium TaxID=99906 RepID=A0A1I1FXG1_9LACT|nr:peptidoglycan DD-metalloendopeptidase family protein [Alkalibacterium subtropicum]SFC04005.1 Murein DD-endopeptidase MepM and murein hydrolase activator NlpD, contain LysM domain [Alkalibacterium subtropicum]